MHISGPIPRDSDSAGLHFEQALQFVLYNSQRAIPSCDAEPWLWDHGASPSTSSLVEGILCAWHGGRDVGCDFVFLLLIGLSLSGLCLVLKAFP